MRKFHKSCVTFLAFLSGISFAQKAEAHFYLGPVATFFMILVLSSPFILFFWGLLLIFIYLRVSLRKRSAIILSVISLPLIVVADFVAFGFATRPSSNEGTLYFILALVGTLMVVVACGKLLQKSRSRQTPGEIVMDEKNPSA